MARPAEEIRSAGASDVPYCSSFQILDLEGAFERFSEFKPFEGKRLDRLSFFWNALYPGLAECAERLNKMLDI